MKRYRRDSNTDYVAVGQLSGLLRYHYSTIPKRHVRDSNPRTLSGQRFSRPLPRPTGHMPRKTPSRRVFHNRNQSGYLVDGDGVEPPEPEGNSFTDCPATTYGISIEKIKSSCFLISRTVRLFHCLSNWILAFPPKTAQVFMCYTSVEVYRYSRI